MSAADTHNVKLCNTLKSERERRILLMVLNVSFFLKETDHLEDLGMYWKITLNGI